MMAMCCGKVDKACVDTYFLCMFLMQARYRPYAQKRSLRLSTGNDKFESLDFDKVCLGRVVMAALAEGCVFFATQRLWVSPWPWLACSGLATPPVALHDLWLLPSRGR